ncbi:mannose-6-phosphate isomerase, class I [Haloplasma contractile]|uniref:mannose-6-phosphate isomerase n=1 Tax=Haloplasma contractile SSD-17B TaxID=1033810 RepID=U2FJK0_9MOLU|nr:mannose-6-phosphate isomerase, class I [Haloplasma contractile]ERJ13000.1 putative mannose-6-phosphate isomerase GmuF protein [Haloplasma contractile SSD-17B]
MQEILFLKPVFQEKIWGGTALRDKFNYDLQSNQTGECWAISAHPNGDCEIINGELKGKRLSEVWQDNRDLFNHDDSPVFPLLTKILDANKDLSVQVHPDDEYGMKHENELGKTECWYIIDCKEDAEMVFGHNAHTKEELEHMIKNGEWNSFLRRIEIKPGDFFYVPTGTIHALCEGTLVLETQQSSDTTYRVYDYDRRDPDGNTRELHIRQAMDVTTVPHRETLPTKTVKRYEDSEIITYVNSDYFTVEKWNIKDKLRLDFDQSYMLVSVLNGKGYLNEEKIEKGNHFIITAQTQELILNGDLELMVSYIEKN